MKPNCEASGEDRPKPTTESEAPRKNPYLAGACLIVPQRIARLVLLANLLLPGILLAVAAQEPTAPMGVVATAPTPEAIQSKINNLEGATALDEGTKARLLDLYTRTRASQDALRKYSEAGEQYARAHESATEEAQAIRAEMEQAGQQDVASVEALTAAAPLAELEAMLVQAKADQAAFEAQLGEIQQALIAEASRPAQARQRLAQARQRQETVTADLQAVAPSGEPPAVREARTGLLQSESLALNAEIRMLDQELLSQPMRIQLLEAQRDRNEHRLASIAAHIGRLGEQVGERRVAQAEQVRQETEQVRRLAEGSDPRVVELAAQNAALSEEITERTRGLFQTAADAEEAKARSARVSELFRNTRQKLERAGLTEALGRVMLEQRHLLMDTRELQRSVKQTTQAMAQAGLRQIQHEEERQQLRDPNAYLLEFTGPPEDAELPVPEEEFQGLVESRRLLIAQALDLDQDYMRALGELDFAQRRLMDAATQYRAFLDERLLWVRTTAGPEAELLTNTPAQLAEMVAPANWSEVLRTLAGRATQSPVLALALLLVVIGTATRGPMRRRLVATGRYIRKPSRDRFTFTIKALSWTLLIAAPWPLSVYVVGRELAAAPSPGDFVEAVSLALCFLAGQFYILNALRAACISDGLAALHFAWAQASRVRLRRRLSRFMSVFLPANFITNLAVQLDASTMGGGIMWFGFLVLAASLATFAVSLFQPRSGVLQPYMQAHPNSLVARLSKVWLVLAVGLPVALAVLATLGYRYTAIVVLERAVVTMYFVAGIVLLHQLITRWLVLSRRRLAVQAVLARRQAAYAEEMTHAEGETPTPQPATALSPVEEPEVDLAALGEETRQLLSYFIFSVAVVGIWMIWSQVLPAFGYLDEVDLWSRTGMVEGEEARVPVTLADVLLAVLIGVAVLLVTKRLPALLEITLLQRMHLTPGARYAAKTLSSYAIVVVGLLFALSFVGIAWSQLQWLVAALGVGIGFGLQEIVANFISGLIILFERPIRVGDLVTVGETDGVVTRIQIRATTIRNWDRKELLVPNKEFITNRLLNWSLSDQTVRLSIEVGLAYGGDASRAMALMVAAAEEHERILDNPAPFACFEEFGDHALILTLSCYTDNPEQRRQTASEVREKINTDFSEAGLVIAFPQRDVHVDTSSPLQIRIQQGSTEHGAAGADHSAAHDRQ